jgi:hypothetical protein
MLQRLIQAQPAQILYVSCHPATLARDLNVLCSSGVFEVSRIMPLDMFPQTQHVECVADVRTKAVPPRRPRLAHEGQNRPSSPSPPHTCGGEGRGEEVPNPSAALHEPAVRAAFNP